ncbi:MAG: ferrous iron transport protein A [Clostridia bacterium]|nr:ferrous iron transport protein A [Clostridia bacterium]
MNKTYKLCDISTGESARIVEILPCGDIRQRFLDIGLIRGTKIKCLHRSRGNDMKAYMIRGAVIAIRNEDCRSILVEKEVEHDGTDEKKHESRVEPTKERRIHS